MRDGVVYRFWRQRDRAGRTLRVRTARFASLADRHLLAIRAEATPGGLPGASSGRAGRCDPRRRADPRDRVRDARRAGLHRPSGGRNGGGHVLAVTTRPAPGSPVARHVEQARDVIGGRLEPGDPATVDRLAAIVSARSKVPSADAARRALARAEELGFDELLRRHRAAWDARWRDADLVVEGDADDQQALRFSIFHMISTAHPTNDTVSVGARGLGGMSYFLHVFWDTEIFVLPFFIYSHPQTARTLLAYRYRNLDGRSREGAPHGAQRRPLPLGVGRQGRRDHAAVRRRSRRRDGPHPLRPDGAPHLRPTSPGASGSTGRCTGDDAFMASMGVEILLETARFWASRASRDDEGRYHIRMVVGPDEYHEGVDDNAYTNVLARWNIGQAVEGLGWLDHVDTGYAAGAAPRLELTIRELDDWRGSLTSWSTASTRRRSSSSSSPASTRWTTCPSRSCGRGPWRPTCCWAAR